MKADWRSMDGSCFVQQPTQTKQTMTPQLTAETFRRVDEAMRYRRHMGDQEMIVIHSQCHIGESLILIASIFDGSPDRQWHSEWKTVIVTETKVQVSYREDWT